jgi:biotin carboxylase
MTGDRLLVVGSGGRVFREYALAAMSRRASVLLAAPQEPSWEVPYLTDHVRVDPYDGDALAAAARRLRVDGVLTYDERLVEPVARLAERTGLPYTAGEAVRTCKDKSLLRRCLDRAGLSPVRYAVARDVDEALAAVAAIGYPVVLKPRALGGSTGVVRVDDEPALLDAFGVAVEARVNGRRSAYPGVLVEEYLDGPEYSLDCVTWEGVTHPLVLAEKTVAFPPYFEEVGHTVPARPHPDLDDAVRLVQETHRAVGLDRLVTHSEFRLTSRGPRMVEVNARIGGDLIPYLGLLATGVDVAGAAADVALGRAPDLRTDRQRVATTVVVYPARDMRVDAVRLRRDRGCYPGLDRFEMVVPPGSEVRLPPRGFTSRAAVAVVVGDTREQCEQRTRLVVEDVSVEGEELLVESLSLT